MRKACAAIEEGLMTQDDLVARVNRSFTLLMDAGLFDPVKMQTYTKIPFDTINSESAQASNLQAARQSLVLLKNGNANVGNISGASSNNNNNNDDNHEDQSQRSDGFGVEGGGSWSRGPTSILPFKKGIKIALVGPHTQTQKDLAGNYFEDIGLGTCAGATCVPTLKTAFDLVNGGNSTIAAGCDMRCESTTGFADAVAAAAGADAVVVALGADGDICGEGKDRMNISLPGHQYDLAKMMIALGKPTVLMLFSGVGFQPLFF